MKISTSSLHLIAFTVLIPSAAVLSPQPLPAQISASWTVDADGTWSNPANWNPATPPDTAGNATFTNLITAPRTITVDSTTRTIKKFLINQSHRLTLAASGAGINLVAAGTEFETLTGSHVVTAPLGGGSVALLVKTGPGTLTLDALNTYGGGTRILNGFLRVDQNNRLGALTGPLINVTLDQGTIVLTSNNTFFRPIIVASGGFIDTLTNAPTWLGTISGDFTGPTKRGAGVLYLAGTNSFSGPFTIDEGTLAVGADAAFGVTPPSPVGYIVIDGARLRATNTFTMASSREIRLNAAPTIVDVPTVSHTFTVPALVRNGASNPPLIKTGSGVLLLNNVGNTYTGGTIVSNGVLSVTADSVLGVGGSVSMAGSTTLRTLGGTTFNRPLILLGGAATFDAETFNSTWSGVVSGTGPLVKIDTGTLTLTGANTFVAGLQINGGTVSVASDANLGAAGQPLSFNGGTLTSTGTFTDSFRPITITGGNGTVNVGTHTLTLQGPIGGAGRLTKSNTAGTLSLFGTNSYAGGTTVSGGRLLGNHFSLQGNITASTASTTVEFNQAAGNGTYAGVISGAGSLIKSGPDELAVSGANSYLSGTTLNAGTLRLANNNVLPDATTVTINAGTLDVDGRSDTITSVAGAGTVNLDGGTLTVTHTTSVTYGGNLTGAGRFLKTGSGTLTLTSASTLSGTLAASAGTVSFPSGSSISGTVQASSSAIVRGEGTVGALIATNSALIAPGSVAGDPGRLTFSSLVVTSAAMASFEIGGLVQDTDYDHLAGSGTASLGGRLDVSFINGFHATVQPGDTFTILTAPGGVTGTFTNAPNGSYILPTGTSDGFFRVDYSATDVKLVYFRNPQADFLNAPYTTDEGIGLFPVTVQLEFAPPLAVSVRVTVTNGTAQAGEDFTAFSQILNFPANQQTANFTIPVINDNLDEDSETVALSLSQGTGVRPGGPTTLTLTDNDAEPVFSFVPTTLTTTEGAATDVINIRLTPPSGRTVSVSYLSDTNLSTATLGADYTNHMGSLTFPKGTTNFVLKVGVINDPLDENNETVRYTLLSPVNATVSATPAVVTISDNDNPPVASVSPTSLTVNESDPSALFNIQLSAASGRALAVRVATSNITAIAGSDFTGIPDQIVHFNPGQTSQQVPVALVNDLLDEFTESALLNITSVSNATIGASRTGTFSITDDDALPEVSVAQTTLSTPETSGTNLIGLRLSAPSGKPVVATYGPTGGSASNVVDYALTGTTVTFPPLTTNVTFPLVAIDDDLDEPDETVFLSVLSVSNGLVGSPATETVTLTDTDPSVVASFSATNYNVLEPSLQVQITVRLNKPSAHTVEVDYFSQSFGEAQGSNVDYSDVSGTLTFAPFQTVRTFLVPIVDDSDGESTERFRLVLTNGVQATFGVNPTFVSILDNEGPPIITVEPNVARSEAAGLAPIDLFLSWPKPGPVAVTYATADDVALAGADYLATNRVVVFPPGATNITVRVPILDDPFSEFDEPLAIQLSNASNGLLTAESNGQLTIVDNDPFPQVAFAVTTNAALESAPSGFLSLALSAPSLRPISVPFSLLPGTATLAQDFSATNSFVQFPPLVTNVALHFPLIDDLIDESNEVVRVVITGATNALTNTPLLATLTLIDDDAPPVAAFVEPLILTPEAGSAALEVRLSSRSAKPISLQFASSNQTALAGADYTAIAGTINFAPGQTNTTLNVPILTDTLDEDDETLRTTLFNPFNVSLGLATSIVQITDDDALPALSVTPASRSVDESAGSTAFDIRLSPVSGRPVSVPFATADGSAVAGRDYLATNGVLHFPAGQTNLTLNLAVLEDSIDEFDESATLTLTSPTNATLGAPTGTLTIQDNDPDPVLTFTVSANSFIENAGAGSVIVQLSAPSEKDITAFFAVVGGSATYNTDYAFPVPLLTLPAGSTNASLPLTLIDDLDKEGTESIQIRLVAAFNAALASPDLATISVIDNDTEPLVALATPSFATNENASARIALVLDEPSTNTLSVTVQPLPLTASGADFDPNPLVAQFLPGATQAVVVLPLVNDDIREPAETVRLQLSSPSAGSALGLLTGATLTILDDEPLPVVQFAETNLASSEGASLALVSVLLDRASFETVTVAFASAEIGSALGSSVDFTNASGLLTIPPFQTNAAFTVGLVDDTLIEGPESLRLDLSAPAFATLGTNVPAVLTILDNDRPTLSVASIATNESAPRATFTFTLDRPSLAPVSVRVATSNDTATAGLDYVATNGLIVLAPGATNATFDVALVNDLLDEPIEVCRLHLFLSTNVVLGTNTALLAIDDDDAEPSISFDTPSYALAEPAGTAAITLSLSRPSAFPVSVAALPDTGSAALGPDLLITNFVATFAPGATQAVLFASVVNDTVHEPLESLTLTLAQFDRGQAGAVPSTVLTVADDDAPPAALTVAFVETTGALTEGGGSISLQLQLSQAAATNVSVTVAVTGGTASLGQDVTLTPTTVTFTNGQSIAALTLAPIDDATVESAEFLTLALVNPLNAALGSPAFATVTIADNETLPAVRFALEDFTVSESQPLAPILLTLSAPHTNDVTVSVALTDGTASSADYATPPLVALFTAGQVSASVAVPILADTLIESNETVLLELQSPSGAILGTPSTATLTLIDDDSGTPGRSTNFIVFADFDDNGYGDILLQRKTRVLAAFMSNGVHLGFSAPVPDVPKKARVLAAGRIGQTNYIAFKVKKEIVVQNYALVTSNAFLPLGDSASFTPPPLARRVFASGDFNGDGFPDIASRGGTRTLMMHAGPAFSEPLPFADPPQRAGRPQGGFDGAIDGVAQLIYRRGRAFFQYQINTTNLSLVPLTTSGTLIKGGRARAFTDLEGQGTFQPIGQRGAQIKSPFATLFSGSATNRLGRVVGPK